MKLVQISEKFCRERKFSQTLKRRCGIKSHTNDMVLT